jgi:hypothetical protein
MDTFIRSLKSIAFPLALLALLTIAFGLLIPTLGFYWDDWPVLLTHRLLGSEGYWEFYTFDRPVSAWTYVVTMPLLGYNAPAWHIFTLLLRFATCLGMWFTLKGIWPERARAAGWATLLFAIYPIFIQQPISVAYSQHWITYLLFFVSLAGMIYAVRRPRWFWPLTVLSLLSAAGHLFTMEYFTGLEMIRPLVLWLVLSNEPASSRTRLRRTFLHYSPYLLVLAAFFIWRVFLLELPGEDVNRLVLLDELRSSPLAAAFQLAITVLQDVVHAIAISWADLLDLNLIDYSRSINFLFWLAAIFTGIITFFFLLKWERPAKTETLILDDRWPYHAMGFGMLIILVGMLPVWLSGRQMIEGLYGNRFGLPAMFGAAVFWVGLLHWLVSGHKKQILLISIMIGLTIGLHLRVANDYRWSRTLQERFYWQLSWRAPSIAPGTAIYSDGEILPYVGWYSTSAGLNLLYPEGQDRDLNYWFFSLGREIDFRLPEVLSGITIEQSLRNFRFEGDSRHGLVIDYQPDVIDCLIVLSPEDTDLPDLPGFTRRALALSDLSRIQIEASPPPDTRIFGPEPERGWCYLYQKAALAQQLEDWEEVVRLGDAAQAQGFNPRKSASDTPQGWLPFIEGYAMTGQLDRAVELSQTLIAEDDHIVARLCQLWGKIAARTQTSGIEQSLGCGAE